MCLGDAGSFSNGHITFNHSFYHKVFGNFHVTCSETQTNPGDIQLQTAALGRSTLHVVLKIKLSNIYSAEEVHNMVRSLVGGVFKTKGPQHR